MRRVVRVRRVRVRVRVRVRMRVRVRVLTLALLLLELVGVVAGAARLVEGVARLHDLDVELDVLGLLLADHDRVVQVEVDDHEDLLLRLRWRWGAGEEARGWMREGVCGEARLGLRRV